MLYFDHNATTPLDARVLDAMLPWLTGTHGNPSSVHHFGRAAHAALETARAQVAALLKADRARVIFTGGGTEANNLALKGICHGKPQGALLVSAVEHAAVQEPADRLASQGWRVERIPVDADGRVQAAALDSLLAEPVTLVSVMLANNETGVIQDIPAIAARVHAAGGVLHCDAIQAASKLPMDFDALGADLVSLSAHKFGGPRGVGALLVNPAIRLVPLVHGGGQEQGARGGTENLAGIVGLGCAAALASAELGQRTGDWRALREHFEAGLRNLPGIKVFAQTAARLPNTVQFGVAGYSGEAMVMELDRRGIAVSSGSACHSASGRPSHVLLAMGLDDATARSAVRVSFGSGNTMDEVEALLAALQQILTAQREQARAVAW